jgi:hypothetical protein
MARDKLSLDVDSPEQVANVLRHAAQEFRESASELESAWQDRGAGRPWDKIAKILDRAADKCDDAITGKPRR